MNLKLDKMVECALCKKSFKNLSNHLTKTHKVSLEEYRTEHGETSYKRKIANKMKELFVTKREKWLYGYLYKDGGWRTNDSKKHTLEKNKFLDRPLTDIDIIRHLAHKYVVGVFFPKGFTKIFCFDVDGNKNHENPHEYAKSITIDLVDELRNYFDPKDVHVVFSGGKGYHILLFFDNIVKISDILAFANVVTEWNKGNLDVNIEFRPESNNGKGVKLPLGVHVKTRKFSHFVDNETFNEVEDSYEYLLNISPIKPLDFNKFDKKETIKQEKGKYAPKKVLHNMDNLNLDEEEIERVFHLGLQSHGVRHQYTFLIAMLLKDKYKLTQDEAIQTLKEWTDREFSEGRTKDNAQKSIHDIESTVKNVYEKNLSIRNVNLTDFEKSVISYFFLNNLPKNKRTKAELENIAKCFEYIIQTGKRWQNKGFFFLDSNKLANILGVDTRTIRNYINKILDSKLLFRVILGQPSKKLMKDIKSISEAEESIIGVREWFEKQPNPKKGYNSLYFCPWIITEFINTIKSEEDTRKLIDLGIIKWFLSYVNSDHIFFKHEIMIKGENQYCIDIWDNFQIHMLLVKGFELSIKDKELILMLEDIKRNLEYYFSHKTLLDTFYDYDPKA